jgi:hypothetical protein
MRAEHDEPETEYHQDTRPGEQGRTAPCIGHVGSKGDVVPAPSPVIVVNMPRIQAAVDGNEPPEVRQHRGAGTGQR